MTLKTSSILMIKQMKQRIDLLMLIAILLLLPSSLAASGNSINGVHDHDDNEECCVVVNPEFEAMSKKRQVRSRFDKTSTASPIKDLGRIYHFRLAACITPEALTTVPFNWDNTEADKARAIREVHAYWNDLENKLNGWYTQDVGIRFHIVRDERLILFQEGNVPIVSVSGGRIYPNKEIIEDALGNETNAYDVSILIVRSNGKQRGVAELGSAISPYLKGRAWAVFEPTTVAHELGHTFGANHTHYYHDANCTEPGNGRSIMSYGSPRDFFSLASIKQMRAVLANFNYYTDENRSEASKVIVNNTTETVMPYAEEIRTKAPELDRTQMKKEYTVTEGTNFQFYLPVEEAGENYFYNVNPFDFSYDRADNSLRPAYKKTRNNNVMFQPEYKDPGTLSPTEKSNASLHLEEHSDASRPGIYTFAAAVNNDARYDGMLVKLNIIQGTPFEIVNVQGANQTFYGRWAGRDMTITWNPCRELYGADSKVRILLSDDFGQTYKYILADDVPNTGNAKVVFPYINIGKVNYMNWTLNQGGGRIKIEVKGEAAYDVYPRMPYTIQGSDIVPKGLEINSAQQYAQFKPKNSGDQLPAIYVEVGSREEADNIAKPELLAYHKNYPGTTISCNYTETEEGTLIRRSWKAKVSNIDYTYTQIIKLPDVLTDRIRVRNEARKLAVMAKELYQNRGNIGYPKTWLPASREFETTYAAVFDTSTHEIKTTVEEKDVQRLNEVLTALTNIEDNDVLKPEHGKYYKVRSYVQPYGRKAYFYLVDDEQGVRFVPNDTNTTLWKCEVKNGKYFFTSTTGHPIFKEVEGTTESTFFDSFTNGGLELTFERGYTWGSLTVLNNQRHSAQLHSQGKTFSTNRDYYKSPLSYRVNCQDGIQVSSDFQFIPVESSVTVVDDPVLVALPTAKKAVVGNITWYALDSTEEQDGVDVVYAAGNFEVGTNGKVQLQIPENLHVNGVNKRVIGIMARTINTGSRYDNQYTYSLGTALADYHFDLIIPSTVKRIKESALANNSNLHTVTLAEGTQLTEIAANAFANSKNMRFANVLLNAANLTIIGSNAFAGTHVEALALTCSVNALRSGSLSGMNRLGFLDLRKVTGTNAGTKIHRGMDALKGLSPHTLVCVKRDAYASQTNEANVVVFDNNPQGVCNQLSLYDYLVDETTQEVKTYGISVPGNGTYNGVEGAGFKAVKATFNRTFPMGYSTLCLPYAAQMPMGMKAYTFTEERRVDGNTQYTFAQVTGTMLNANTPYVVYCNQEGLSIPENREVEVSGIDRYTVGNTLDASAGNPLFVGTFSVMQHHEAISLRGIYSFNSASQQWMRIYDENGDINTRAMIVPYRAFFLNSNSSMALAKAIHFATDDTTTSLVLSVKDDEPKASPVIYSIDGRRMTQRFDQLPKGIYIVNGKKVVR